MCVCYSVNQHMPAVVYHTGCFIDRLVSDKCPPNSPYLFYKSKRRENRAPWQNPAKGPGVSSLDSQATGMQRLRRRMGGPGLQGQGAGEVAEQTEEIP